MRTRRKCIKLARENTNAGPSRTSGFVFASDWLSSRREFFLTNHGVRWLKATVSGNGRALTARRRVERNRVRESGENQAYNKVILYSCEGRTNCLTVSICCLYRLTNFCNPLTRWTNVSSHKNILPTSLSNYVWLFVVFASFLYKTVTYSTSRMIWSFSRPMESYS